MPEEALSQKEIDKLLETTPTTPAPVTTSKNQLFICSYCGVTKRYPDFKNMTIIFCANRTSMDACHSEFGHEFVRVDYIPILNQRRGRYVPKMQLPNFPK